MVRLLLAACFVYGGVLLAVVLLGDSPVVRMPLLLGLTLALLLCVLVIAALVLFNRGSAFPLHTASFDERLAELDAEGRLETTEYRATRAFQIAEFEDEGPSYFIELEDGSMLFLTGQQLYEYEETTDDPELNQPRRFPCTEFTTRRHRVDRYLIDIVCRGDVLEPDVVAPPWSARDYKAGRIPDDGAVITDRTYDQIKEERLRASAARD
jgi:hypothetical protein